MFSNNFGLKAGLFHVWSSFFHIISSVLWFSSTLYTCRRQLDHGARIFNYRLSRARRIVENAFGQLAAVWRIYRRPINVEPDKVDNIVLASCVLQNYLLTHRNIQYTSDSDAYVYDGSWRQVLLLNLFLSSYYQRFTMLMSKICEKS